MPTPTDVPLRPQAADNAPLRFHHLTFLDDGDDVVVGRPDVDSYAVLPTDGAAFLRRLYDGDAVDDVARWYSGEYGETVDVGDFLDSMRELGFLREDVAADLDEDSPGAASDSAGTSHPTGLQPVRWQRLGAAVFSAPAWLAYLVMLCAGVAVVVADPSLAPHRDHIFFTDSFVVIELTLFLLQFPLVLAHECAHVLAGRRLGLRTKVRISRRLYFLVFETVMNGLVSVPRGKRYLPMLAGMLTDLVIAAAFTVAAWALRGPVADIEWAAGLCLALALTTLLRIVWQLYFFLRTDIYFLVTTVLGCVDLHTTTRQYLRNGVNRRLGRHDRIVPEETWHPRDRRAARWYAPLVVVGYALAIALLVLVLLPIAWTFMSEAVGRVFLGTATSGAQFWDSALLLTLNGAQLALAAVLAVSERRAAHRSENDDSTDNSTDNRPTVNTPRREHDSTHAAPLDRRSGRALTRRPAGRHVRPRTRARHRKR